MQAEDRRQVVDPALGDDVERAAGHQLLGGLEEQPHPPGQPQRRQREARAEDHAGVDVVAAGVAAARGARAVRHVLGVLQRQRVDVGAQADDRAVALADVADQAGADAEHLGREARRLQPLDEHGRGAVLLAAELGVGVQVPAQRDEVGLVGREPAVDGGRPARQVRSAHATAPGAPGPSLTTGSAVGRSWANSSSRLSTTAVRSPPLAAATARCRW